MAKRTKRTTSNTRKTLERTASADRSIRKTYPLTQRGIRDSNDLSEFHTAALSDIDAGRSDPKEMTLMVAITGQMLAHENLKYKVGLHKTVSSAAHKFFPTIRGVHGKAKSATAKQLLAALQTEVLAAQ